jgi:hypothetical protein
VVGPVVGVILGLACIGYGVFQLLAPRRQARLGMRYHRWWYARIPWFYSVPTIKRLLEEDWQARATRLYGPLFVAIGLVIAVRVVIAAVAEMRAQRSGLTGVETPSFLAGFDVLEKDPPSR